MDEAKHKAAILGDLARLKSTWGKVQASIAQEKEEAECARQRAVEEEARKAREAMVLQIRKVEIVHSAFGRVVAECGPGFKRIDLSDRDPALVRLRFEPTGDELWVTEPKKDGLFLISVMRADRQAFSQNTEFLSTFTEEAIMTICMKLMLNAHRKYIPAQPEGRIL